IPEECLRKSIGGQPVIAIEKHSLTFDLGSVFSHSGDGSWESNPEIAVRARTLWSPNLEGGFEARLSSIGSDKPAEGETTEAEPAAEMPAEAGAKEPSEEKAFDPFVDGGNLLQARVYGFFTPGWRQPIGLILGAGVSTVPSEQSRIETRTNVFGGVRFAVNNYNAGQPSDSLSGSNGFVQVGYAKDNLWESVVLMPATETTEAVLSDESKRWFLEGELELPAVGNKWLRILTRLHVSLPTSGDGPSDVRVSALAKIDPRQWFGGIGKGSGS
ncbi:MAG: hypothetical protein K8J08_10295, partial [Thermoanaerobaculia bacterium]|nr:hypothetical protein [Thermoanaerobaculia bacterium]